MQLANSFDDLTLQLPPRLDDQQNLLILLSQKQQHTSKHETRESPALVTNISHPSDKTPVPIYTYRDMRTQTAARTPTLVHKDT